MDTNKESENLSLLEYINKYCEYVDENEQKEIEALNIDFDDLTSSDCEQVATGLFFVLQATNSLYISLTYVQGVISTRSWMYDEKSNLMMDCRSNAGDLRTMEAYRYQLIYKSFVNLSEKDLCWIILLILHKHHFFY